MSETSPHALAAGILTNKKLWVQVTGEPEFNGQRRAIVAYKTTVEKTIVNLLCNMLGGTQKITKKDETTNPGTIAIYMKPADLETARKPYLNQNSES